MCMWPPRSQFALRFLPQPLRGASGHRGARLPQAQLGDRYRDHERPRLQAAGWEEQQADHLYRGLRRSRMMILLAIDAASTSLTTRPTSTPVAISAVASGTKRPGPRSAGPATSTGSATSPSELRGSASTPLAAKPPLRLRTLPRPERPSPASGFMAARRFWAAMNRGAAASGKHSPSGPSERPNPASG